jgi:signal transduction histidine kinase
VSNKKRIIKQLKMNHQNSEPSEIMNRISEKISDYDKYSFNQQQDHALKAFFDLSQEFVTQQDFYNICVLIPKLFFKIDCNLFLKNKENHFELVCSSKSPVLDTSKRGVYNPGNAVDQTLKDDCFTFLIKGNMQLLPNLTNSHKDGVLGIYEICSGSTPSDHTKLFFEKYVNRIGFQLHNRIITEKNKEHLQFIKNLVNDIGHNVIVPNMYFKLFFKRLKGKIDRANLLSSELVEQLKNIDKKAITPQAKERLLFTKELKYVNTTMENQFQEILSHYEQTSLFLETLLRRSHFEEGRYVIEPKKVNFREKVIRLQLDRFLPQLEERGIAVDNQLSDIPDEEITVVADVGLISQAYANLFSNAVKYTREIQDKYGKSHKFVAVGIEVLANFFGGGRDGLKLNVFSTGPHISPEDASKLFDEGFRGNNVGSEYGTGHGLQFVREVIDLHGGVNGYEAKPWGNNFYFILPR